MADKLTAQQQQAVMDTGGKLLVSAAAGSGKTKVLVERLMRYLTDPVAPANIDDFLIITYTKAAAAELRGKIAAKLSERLLEEPDNRHLQRQMQRLYLTQISTVHSFCTELLRDYAYRLDISGDFRVAEENECLEIQSAILEQILNESYNNIHHDPDLATLLDTQGLGRDDRQVPQIILQVYNSARCHLDPQKWLDWCLSVGDVTGIEDASQTVWGKYLVDDLHRYLDLQIITMNRCASLAESADGMGKPAKLLHDTVYQLEKLRGCSLWDEIIANMSIDYGRLTFSKACADTEIAERIKAARDACKKGLAKRLQKFSDSSQQVLEDLVGIAQSTRGLIGLTQKFMTEYSRRKRSKRILDFGDLEHMALDLLLGKQRACPTLIATELGQRYREVMVDEYQDSNQVQDAIFSAITQARGNCFMVGDVKQSIYQFRLADPGIFLKKYNAYQPAERAAPGVGRKVLLSSNFRSASSVIEAVNHVFKTCMSVEVGGLVYGEDEALKEGRSHQLIEEPEIELHAIDVQSNTYLEEATFVAQRIRQLLDGSHMIRSEDQLRPIRPEDIVILLRSPGSVGAVYARALEALGIRCCFGGSINVLQTEEIQLLRSLLQIIDNPLQDIPLVCVLSSRVFGFSADKLAEIRSAHRGGSIYSALRTSDDPIAVDFVKKLNSLRNQSRLLTLPQLLREIFIITKLDSIYGAMPDGKLRMENIQIFSQLASAYDSGNRSLGRFIKHLEALDEKGVAGAGEQTTADAVTIMSIHKSKGLEFPVVFLSGLSRAFNRDNARAQVLCDKDLGLGLSCVDTVNRVRYPSIAKRAIASKILSEGLSEELRVLYVAMTRPKDRLIMTYASDSLASDIAGIVNRMDVSEKLLLTENVDCPGAWILLSALRRPEAGALFNLGGYPATTSNMVDPWLIQVQQVEAVNGGAISQQLHSVHSMPQDTVERLEEGLSFHYRYSVATKIPSKQTATQLKGRMKDREAAEMSDIPVMKKRNWRKPKFITGSVSGREYGNAYHNVMQYISYVECRNEEGVKSELDRLRRERYISAEQAALVDACKITDFFATDIGKKLVSSNNILREFKFSILDDASRYCSGVTDESVLLQGVVDCAMLEADGITVLDFKTDKVTKDTVQAVADTYRAQVTAYADALKRIYQMPIKATMLYFFSIGEFVTM